MKTCLFCWRHLCKNRCKISSQKLCNLLFFVQGFPKKCRNSMNGSRTKDRFSLVKVNNVFRQSAWGTQAVVLKAPLWAYCEGHVLVNKVKHFFIMDLPSPVGIELKNALNTVCPKKHLKIGSIPLKSFCLGENCLPLTAWFYILKFVW